MIFNKQTRGLILTIALSLLLLTTLSGPLQAELYDRVEVFGDTRGRIIDVTGEEIIFKDGQGGTWAATIDSGVERISCPAAETLLGDGTCTTPGTTYTDTDVRDEMADTDIQRNIGSNGEFLFNINESTNFGGDLANTMYYWFWGSTNNRASLEADFGDQFYIITPDGQIQIDGNDSINGIKLSGMEEFHGITELKITSGGTTTLGAGSGEALLLTSRADMDGNRIQDMAEPTSDSDAATKNYVDLNAGGSGDGGMSAWGDGSDTVTDPDTGVAGDNIDLVPSATPGKFRLNASGGGSSDTAGLRFSDDGVFQGIFAEANFGTDLSVNCSGDTCTVNSTASGGGGSGWPGTGEILASDGNIYTDLSTAMNNADSYVILGPGNFSDSVDITADDFWFVGSGNKTVIDPSSQEVTSWSNNNTIHVQADRVHIENVSFAWATSTERSAVFRIDGGADSTTIDNVRVFVTNTNADFRWILRHETGAGGWTVRDSRFQLKDNMAEPAFQGGSERIKFLNNEVTGNGDNSTIVNPGDYSVIANNDWSGSNRRPVSGGGDFVVFTNNTVQSSRAFSWGLDTGSSADSWTIVANTFDIVRHAIELNGDNNLVGFNIMHGCGGEPCIVDNGSRNQFLGNLTADGTNRNDLYAPLDMNTNKINNVDTPGANADAANKGYVDQQASKQTRLPAQTFESVNAALGGGDTLVFHQFDLQSSDTIGIISSHVTPDTTNAITGLELAIHNLTDGVDVYSDTTSTLDMNADRSSLATSDTVGGDRLKFMIRNDSGDTRVVSAMVEVRLNRP